MNLRIFCLFLTMAIPARADWIDDWLLAQGRLKTWQADFTQTRTLKTLKQPLQSKGRLVFGAPNNFRWELGDPAQTIAIRNANEMFVIYPKLKTAERYVLSGAGNEPWREALALMDAGFPAGRAELESRFKILSTAATNGVATVVMQPKSALARRFMAEVQIFLRAGDFGMLGNQLRFADGSVLRNDFTNAVVNPGIAANSFAAEIPKDYAVNEPMKK